MVKRCELGLPAWLYHRGGVFLGNDGRAGNDITRTQILSDHQGGVQPLPLCEHAHRFTARHVTRRVDAMTWFGGRITGHDRLDRHSLHHQRLALHQERIALAVGGLKAGLNLHQHIGQLCGVRVRYYQRGIAAFVAHMHAAVHHNGAAADLLAHQLVLRHRRESRKLVQHARQRSEAELGLHSLFANHGLIGQAHAIGTEYARQRVHKDARHPQRIGHQTGVLTAGTAKTLQGVARDVVTASDRYFLDGIGHLLHGDADEAFRHLLGRPGGLAGQLVKLQLHRLAAQRLISARAKYPGEIVWLNFPQHHIRIGYSQGAAPAVTGGPRVGTRTLRPHPETRTIEGQQRTATRSHGVDAHHRCAHAHPRHLGLELALKPPGVMRDIGGGATHVKSDHLLDAGNSGRARHPHNATRRTTQNRVFAGEGMGIGQPPGGLHEKQLDPRHFTGHLLHIAAQDGRQIRIHHSGVATTDKLHHRAGFMRGADLSETHFQGNALGGQLMLYVAVTMHKNNRNAPQPSFILL